MKKTKGQHPRTEAEAALEAETAPDAPAADVEDVESVAEEAAPAPYAAEPDAPSADPAPESVPDIAPVSGVEPDQAEGPTAPSPSHPEPAAPPVTPPPSVRRSGMLPALLGGVLAAGVGYGAAQFVKPEGWPFPGSTDVQAQLAAQTARIAALEEGIAALQSAPADAALADLTGRLDQAQAGLDDLVTRLAALETAPRPEAQPVDLAPILAEIEALKAALAERPAIVEDVTAQIEAATAAATARMAEAEAQAAAMRAEAEQLARQAAARAAVARLLTAADGGQGLSGPLADLQAAGVDLPPALAAAGEGPIPTLATLQDAFPEAARAALAASQRQTAEGGIGDRVATFLLNQTKTRSLEPREGDDPDAVLSRAEAAVKGNDLAAALDLIGQLPAEGQDAMADWATQARARLDVLQAIDAVNTSLAE